MADSVEYFTFSVRRYDDGPNWGIRCMSSNKDRFAIDLGRVSLIFELWFIRGGLSSC